MKRRVPIVAWLALCVAVFPACGSRTDLAIAPAPSVDASVVPPGPHVPPRFRDRWWFNTVRALCDTFAIEFCDDGRVMTRLSLDDSCAGDAPVTDAPVEAPVMWTSETELVLLVSAPPFGPPMEVPMRLRLSAEGEELDRMELGEGPGLPSGSWSDGVRASTVPFEIPDDFVFCD